MADQTPNTEAAESLKKMQGIWLDGWAKMLGEGVQTPEYGKMMGQWMETWLSTGGSARQQLEQITEQYLEQMSLPSRKELTSVAKRITHLEMKLDDLDAKMDQVVAYIGAMTQAMQAAMSTQSAPAAASDRGAEAAPATSAPGARKTRNSKPASKRPER